MISLKRNFKAHLSALLALTVVTFFSLSSLAAFEDGSNPDESIENAFPALQDPTGTLTKAQRQVYINNVEAKEGATVLSGSIMRTGTDSRAIVDIPSIGTADYGRLTESLLTLSEKNIDALLNRCGSITLTLQPGVTGTIRIIHRADVGVFSERKEVDVRVYRGQATVKRAGGDTVLDADDHEEYDDAIEVTATGDAVFSVYCHEDHPIALFFLPSFAALLIPFGEDERPPVLTELNP
jgi:hypothetical protein